MSRRARLVSLPDSMIVCDGTVIRLAHMIALHYLDPTPRFQYSARPSMSAFEEPHAVLDGRLEGPHTPLNVIEVCRPSALVQAASNESRVDEVEAVRVEGEGAVDVVKLDSNVSARLPLSREDRKHPGEVHNTPRLAWWSRT